MVIFKSKQKKFKGDLKIKLCGKRLHPTESVKYLGVKIDTNLTWQHAGFYPSIFVSSWFPPKIQFLYCFHALFQCDFGSNISIFGMSDLGSHIKGL